MGLTNSVRYKSWDFSITARASIGNYAYNNLASNSVRFSFPPNDAILNTENLITKKELDRLARCWSNL